MASDVLVWIKKILPIETASFDLYAYLVPTQVWKDWIEFDWTREKKYLEDVFDCDDFAHAFGTHASEILDITVFRVYGLVHNKNTGKKIGYHYWNAAVSQDPDGKHLYFIEPQNGIMTEVLGQKEIIMGEMKYTPVKIYLY